MGTGAVCVYRSEWVRPLARVRRRPNLDLCELRQLDHLPFPGVHRILIHTPSELQPGLDVLLNRGKVQSSGVVQS
jgi:hypothetical protein